MPKTVTVEVWVLVDSDEGYEVGTDKASAKERYDSNIDNNESAHRYVKVTVTVPLPVDLEATATLTDDEQATASV